jgi:transcriptional regulator with XRE-family HTH domain
MLPHQIVPVRIRELREQHGWSQADLTRVLNRFGAGLDRSQVARVEQGDRGIPVDELVLFALALNTSLVNLLFPSDDDARVDLMSEGADERVEVSAREGRAWARGQYALYPAQDMKLYVMLEPRSELPTTHAVAEGELEAEEVESEEAVEA